MKRETILVLIGALFTILFLYTGLEKIIDHAPFLFTVRKSTLLNPIAVPISYVVPVLEVFTAILFQISYTRVIALYASLMLMATFSVYVGLVLASNSRPPCSCGGIVRYLNWHQHLYFNISFTFLALIGILITNRANKPMQPGRNTERFHLTQRTIG